VIDLTRTDVYESSIVPDEDCEIALKVLRTLRHWMMIKDLGGFADEVIILSHAHRVLVEQIENSQEDDDETKPMEEARS
jgi:hypothetical protein